jgi:PIN like domain
MGAGKKKSKKPSGTKAEQLLRSSTFFSDECLGRLVPERLRAVDMLVESWEDHFKAGTEDSDWLPVVGERGWIVLTKDKAIRRKPWEMEKVVKHGVRMFTLPNGNMNAEQMAAIFLDNRLRMARVLHKNRFPFIATVFRDGVQIEYPERTE